MTNFSFLLVGGGRQTFSRTIAKSSMMVVAMLMWTIILFYATTYNRSPVVNHQRHAHRRVHTAIHNNKGQSKFAHTVPGIYAKVQRGNYTVLQNVLVARRFFHYDDSITLTTHATYEDLDNLIELSRRWDGPISIAVFAPWTDFGITLQYAQWLRRCYSNISDLVTFHFLYPTPGLQIWVPNGQFWSDGRLINVSQSSAQETKKIPFIKKQSKVQNKTTDVNNKIAKNFIYDYSSVLKQTLLTNEAKKSKKNDVDQQASKQISCDHHYPQPPTGHTYRKRNRLPLPINLSRNTARRTARTHYVMAVDVELYPSAGVIPKFLNFIRQKNRSSSVAPSIEPPTKQVKSVYVLPHFELMSSVAKIPHTKKALAELYQQKKAVDFHKYKCAKCHIIPKLDEWLQKFPESDTMNVFTTIKRQKEFNHWEPFYIGTNSDPFYSELLTWEGGMNKMTQMFEICMLNYDLVILDNAFLVHRPGIKRRNMTERNYRQPYITENSIVYWNEIRKMEKKYGSSKLCI